MSGFVPQQVPLPAAPEALPILGPSEAAIRTAAIGAIAFVVTGAGLLLQRAWLMRGTTANGPRGRAAAIVGILLLALGVGATVRWAFLIDVSAAWAQARLVGCGAAVAVIAATIGSGVTASGTADVLLRTIGSGGALASVCGLALMGHARTTDAPAVSVTSDLVHLVCAAVWVGGVAVVAVSSVGPGALRGGPVHDLLGRFSTLAGVSVGLLGVSGVVLAVRIAGSLEEAFRGTRGTLLIVKLVLAWTAAVLGAVNSLVLSPRARREGEWGAVRHVAGAELAVLAAVLVVAALLGNESPLAH